MSKSGIYQILNLVNGQEYIGSACDFERRAAQHRHFLKKGNHHSRHLQSAWQKYGVDAFAFTLLEPCAKERLIAIEQVYLDWRSPAYNVLPRAGSPLGSKQTEEHKAKRSAALKGRPLPDWHIAALRGKKRSIEARMRMSAGQRRKKPVTEMTRKRISKAQIRRWERARTSRTAETIG